MTTAQLEKEFQDSKLVFVSFSVDPVHDTPAVLAQYAGTYGANNARWHFLTGDKEKVFSLIRKSFHLAVEGSDNKDPNDILHSTMFAVVDPEGQIRGYYNSTE